MGMYRDVLSVTRTLEGTTILVYTTQVKAFSCALISCLNLRIVFATDLRKKRRSRGAYFLPSKRQNDIIFRGLGIPLSVNIRKKIRNSVLV